MKIPFPKFMIDEVASYDIELFHPPATVLDIGANMGAYTARILQKYPKAEVYCFEPVKSSFARLQENFKDLPNVTVVNSAVMPEAGQREINVGEFDANGDMNLGVTSGFKNLGPSIARTELVDCIAAKDLVSADLVKIDTEGCEVEILKELDLSNTKAVVAEWHTAEDREAIDKIMKAAGFRLAESKPEADGNVGHCKYCRYGAIKPIKLFIALPVYNQMPAQVVSCLMALQKELPPGSEIHFQQGDGVARSRNILAAHFLRSDCDRLMFIDCDIIFAPWQVQRLVSHDVDVIGGLYPKKQQGRLEWVINVYHPIPEPTPEMIQEVAYMGTGFLCIKRQVFEKMAKAYPACDYMADYGARLVEHDFFQMGVYRYPDGSGRYLSEDWYFCQKWKDMGGKVYADLQVPLKHLGPVIFPLDTQFDEIENPKEQEPPKPEELIAV